MLLKRPTHLLNNLPFHHRPARPLHQIIKPRQRIPQHLRPLQLCLLRQLPGTNHHLGDLALRLLLPRTAPQEGLLERVDVALALEGVFGLLEVVGGGELGALLGGGGVELVELDEGFGEGL